MANGLADPTQGRARPIVGAEVRATAARVVLAVLDDGRSLTDALDRLPAFADDRDRALTQELSFGTLRLLPRLEALSAHLSQRPPGATDRGIAALILVGLYQLAETRIPPHAAVAATVAAARVMGKPHAAGFVNALLRRYLREQTSSEGGGACARGDEDLFPNWLRQALSKAWPSDWTRILTASSQRPPMTLRVNLSKTTRAAYARQLAAAGLTARPVADAPAALMLDRPVPVTRLPGFADGLASVQDAGAQLAAELLDARSGERVLDACAAPGGKSAHILERSENQVALTAVDIDAERLQRVRETLARLGLEAADIAIGDAADPSSQAEDAATTRWHGRRYDRILLDVPCSATGVMRRHPDIKWLRRPADIPTLCAQQARILDAAWPLLEPGGRLLYTTCSLLPEENAEQIADFLARRPDALEEPIAAGWGVALAHGRQTLPAPDGPDGFFFATLRKAAP